MTRISSQLESCANDDTRNNSGPSIMNHGIYSRQGGVLIHIDRKSFGLPEGTETIRERWESDTLVRFVEFIYHALGNSSLEKLSKLRINRGPFVSNNPSQDYKYQTHRGRTKMYAHKSVLGTGYFVLTNNTCDEKIDCINAAWKYLGLPAGSVKVEKMIS